MGAVLESGKPLWEKLEVIYGIGGGQMGNLFFLLDYDHLKKPGPLIKN